ncbi:MAG: carbon-nitrogen hydrolase family protein [Bdellovibrionaceae bacterium]|nr:carbon-nitrogen hydrolase family protein [Pseudobdellovibrionaceae bacterium]
MKSTLYFEVVTHSNQGGLLLNRVRVATLQYFIRPVLSFQDFEAQVESLVETAADYKVRLIVFPEYFTTQLLTLGNIKVPIHEQIRGLAKQEDRFCELMAKLAKKHNVYIVGGTIPSLSSNGETVYNRCHVFSPSGKSGYQSKLHMTRFESEEWHVSSGKTLKIFETDFGKFSVAICYDVEFPEIARAAAQKGAQLLITPSCTDDRQGFLRVRYCAHARTIENQMYVIHSATVGSLPMVPAISLNYGQAAILNPSDFSFSRDGILAEGVPNQEAMVIGEINLALIDESRKQGTVLPLRDSQHTSELIDVAEVVQI